MRFLPAQELEHLAAGWHPDYEQEQPFVPPYSRGRCCPQPKQKSDREHGEEQQPPSAVWRAFGGCGYGKSSRSRGSHSAPSCCGRRPPAKAKVRGSPPCRNLNSARGQARRSVKVGKVLGSSLGSKAWPPEVHKAVGAASKRNRGMRLQVSGHDLCRSPREAGTGRAVVRLPPSIHVPRVRC